ncbi:Uncharacterised protein [Serratia rubidaea]|uniref:hypothetical protein n=1 Tax=Serratia TaxID=613 RepID=UPI0002A72086|nr:MULTISPECIES: hypothetical protein [Serratia]AGB83039.1 hypothetical protein D781_2788 [Serratia sp. FGI94]MBD8452547.1 hypothetical protein [Serratia rubidaea]QPR63306.1 hypothetical protein I6G83_21345 [Serratia rubidaea]CAI0743968.1 Uncharacterised protein [Serratia rubidaea]CAI1550637.1 Uncharacterised protein [Serratia rubidaea]
MSMPLSTYPYSYGFPVSYFLISIAVLLGLYFLRKKTIRLHWFPLFTAHFGVTVVCIVLQTAICLDGEAIFDRIYPAIDFPDYPEVWYGSIFFIVAYFLLLPPVTNFEDASETPPSERQ